MSATALAILGAAAASSAAQMYANSQNIKYASESNLESVALANTAHQREVRDLMAAGLNPILSAHGSGAQTPTLRTPGIQSPDGGIGNSGTSLARALNGQMQAESDIAQADATSAKAEAREADRIATAKADIAEADAYESRARNAGHLYTGLANQIEEAARLEALSGNRPQQVVDVLDGSEAWRTYNNLVKQYQNDIEAGRYKSSLGRALLEDGLKAVNSASSSVNLLRSRKGGRR